VTALAAPAAGVLAAPARPVGDVPAPRSRRAVRVVLGAVAVAHGLVHLMGLSGPLADGRPELRLLWAAAAAAWLVAGLGLATGRRRWWLVGAPALVLSQAAVMTSWADAKAGTVANAVLLLAVLHGYAVEGPRSLRARYRREAGAAWAEAGGRDAGAARAEAGQREASTPTTEAGQREVGTPTAEAVTDPAVPSAAGLVGPPAAGLVGRRDLVTEADLAALPPLVAGYLRRTGAVGRPRVRAVRATFSGRMRLGEHRPWMALAGEQVNTYGAHVTRRAIFDATLHGLPTDGLHVMVDGAATMRIRPAGILTVVDAAGPAMDQGETVTVLNDLCFLAPAALLDADVSWHERDGRTVGVEYRLAGRTVRADLVFDDAGDLVDFVSDDRFRSEGDGFVAQRWSTPLTGYREVAGRRVASRGDARWDGPEGQFPYIELRIDGIEWR
jgi:hypothetical protein